MSSTARCSNSSATGRSPLFSALPIGAVIFVRTADRLLEDRRVGRDALDAVGVDQLLQVALGDEAAGQEIQPDRLAVVFECFDGIHDALCSIFRVPAPFLAGSRVVNTWLGVPTSGIWVFEQNNAIHNNSIPAGSARSINVRRDQGSGYSAACVDGERMVSTPSAAVAEIVVRTIRRGSCAGHGRPRCMVARLSHITTSPSRHWCR